MYIDNIFSHFSMWLPYTIVFILCFPVMIQTRHSLKQIHRSNLLRLDIEQWEVGLVEMFIPDYGFNIKYPREESLKITYKRVIEDEGGIGLAKVNAVDYIGIKEGRYSTSEWVNKINDRIRVTM